MKNLILFAMYLLAFTIILTGQTLQDSLQQEIQALIDQAIAEQKFMGGVAAAGFTDRASVYSTGGWANAETKEAFTANTLCRIASVAKPMTAVATLQLYEKGLLDLDTPIQQHLPDFPNGNKITARHLLYQLAGISNYKGKETENKKDYPNLAAAIEVFEDRSLLHEPGTAFAYSTYGYTILGRIIEVVAGQDYESYMKANIWEPAGMMNTGIEHADVDYENKSALYILDRKGRVKEGTRNNLSNRIPGGGFYSTAEDLLKFGRAVVDHTLLTEETTELMFSLSEVKKEGSPYAMGWVHYGPVGREELVVGHAGEQTGSATQFMINRKAGYVIVVMTNTGRAWGDVVKLALDMFPPIEKAILGK